MVDAMRRHLGLGLVAMLLSCAAFGTSGPFAKALMTAGWSPGAVVLGRISGAALMLLPFSLWSLRGRWGAVSHELPRVALYGTLAVAAAQLGYFQAVARMDVGVALLIEYLGIVLVVIIMIGYYRFSGLLAVAGLLFYALTTLAFLAMMGASITLPGIAGFILSIGMAVEALERAAGHAKAAGPEEWWRQQLASAFRTILTREGLTRRSAAVKKILTRWP